MTTPTPIKTWAELCPHGRTYYYEGTFAEPYNNRYVPFGEGELAGGQHAEHDPERDATIAAEFIADVLTRFPTCSIEVTVNVPADTLDAFDEYTARRYMLGT